MKHLLIVAAVCIVAVGCSSGEETAKVPANDGAPKTVPLKGGAGTGAAMSRSSISVPEGGKDAYQPGSAVGGGN